METNPEIACGFFKGSKEVLARFWRKAESELNSMGPPTKCIAEWKKVWADQKKYVRQKASQNLRERKCTGGGPNKEQKLSSTEEAIYNLIGMKASVEGVPAKHFGLSPPNPDILAPLDADFIFLDDVPDKVEDTENSQENKPLSYPTTGLKNSSFHKNNAQKDLASNSYKTLEAEVEVQRELLETIKLIVVNQKEQEQTTRKIYRSLDKIHDQNKKHFALIENIKREEIQEMRRHNAFMEKLRVREVEYKLDKNRLQMQIQEYTK